MVNCLCKITTALCLLCPPYHCCQAVLPTPWFNLFLSLNAGSQHSPLDLGQRADLEYGFRGEFQKCAIGTTSIYTAIVDNWAQNCAIKCDFFHWNHCLIKSKDPIWLDHCTEAPCHIALVLTIIQMIIVVVMLMMLVVMVMILAVMLMILVVMVVMLMVLMVVLSILTRHPSPHESVSAWVCPAASSRNRGGLFSYILKV